MVEVNLFNPIFPQKYMDLMAFMDKKGIRSEDKAELKYTDSPSDSPPPASHDTLKMVYKPSLPRIVEDLSKPASMERVWDEVAY